MLFVELASSGRVPEKAEVHRRNSSLHVATPVRPDQPGNCLATDVTTEPRLGRAPSVRIGGFARSG
jgi:hypothetical protein